MAYDVNDELARRLSAARPQTARAEDYAVDGDLLARLREQPIGPHRRVPRAVAVPVAAGVTVAATAAVMLGGGPGDVGGPSSASAITQTLRWLTPPAGTILHVRSTETMGGETTIHELWQSADHPAQQREVVQGASTVETSGDGLYDPATDTIYDGGPSLHPKPGDAASGLVADPVVRKVRTLLQDGDMEVTGREMHNGTDAWAISLKPGFGRPSWTLWVSAADGKPLELRDPGRDANEQPQVIRWPVYEVLPDSNAGTVVTLRGAHPSARVVHDPEQAAAAEQRLIPPQG
jgi:hypothetical protein